MKHFLQYEGKCFGAELQRQAGPTWAVRQDPFPPTYQYLTHIFISLRGTGH